MTVTEDEAIQIAQPFSKRSYTRLKAMAKAIVRLDKTEVEGDFVECGVWQGGGVILARLLSPQRTIWLYDTFNGMANRCAYDVTRNGYKMPEGKSAASVDDVIANLEHTGTFDPLRLRIIVGKVEDTLLHTTPDKTALLHLDTDWYHSTKIELEVLWPKLQPKGIMIVDDYGHWEGARRAVDEYFVKNPVPRIDIDYTAILMVKV